MDRVRPRPLDDPEECGASPTKKQRPVLGDRSNGKDAAPAADVTMDEAAPVEEGVAASSTTDEGGLNADAWRRINEELPEGLTLSSTAWFPTRGELSKLQAANRQGGCPTTVSDIREPSSSADAERQLRETVSGVAQLHAFVWPGEEDELANDFDAAIANGDVRASKQFGKIVFLIGKDARQRLRERRAADGNLAYATLVAGLERIRRAIAEGAGQPWLNAAEPALLVRQIEAGDFSTPGKYSFHFDGVALSDHRLSETLVDEYRERREDYQLLSRCCFTVGAENVTLLGDAKGRTLLTLRAPYPSAGISMDGRVRGFIDGEETRMLHSGGFGLPCRLQFVFDWAVFCPARWNSSMATMQVEDVLAQPDFDPNDKATIDLINELMSFVIEE